MASGGARTLRTMVRAYVAGGAFLLAVLVGLSVVAVHTIEEAAATEAGGRRRCAWPTSCGRRRTTSPAWPAPTPSPATAATRAGSTRSSPSGTARARRPEHYDGIYWDVVTATGTRPTRFGPAIAYDTLAAETGFSAEELALLQEARNRSDGLAGFETEAFATLEAGEGTPDEQAARQRAIDLLNGEGYHRAKAEIMEPIGRVFELVDARTRQETADASATARRYSLAAVSAAVVLLLRHGGGGDRHPAGRPRPHRRPRRGHRAHRRRRPRRPRPPGRGAGDRRPRRPLQHHDPGRGPARPPSWPGPRTRRRRPAAPRAPSWPP